MFLPGLIVNLNPHVDIHRESKSCYAEGSRRTVMLIQNSLVRAGAMFLESPLEEVGIHNMHQLHVRFRVRSLSGPRRHGVLPVIYIDPLCPYSISGLCPCRITGAARFFRMRMFIISTPKEKAMAK